MTLPRRRSGWIRGLFATARPARSPKPATRSRTPLRLEPLEDRAVPADLSVTLTDTPDPVVAGQILTYTIGLSNAGPDAAADVSLTDMIPANTTFTSFTAPAGFTVMTPPVGGTGTITATNPSFASGASVNFTLVVQVDESTAGGTTLTDTATVNATNESNPANNTATATTDVDARADLTVTVTDTPDPVIAGANLTYTIGLTNAGPLDAQGVSLTDMIPANTTFTSFTAPAGFTVMTPPVGGTGTITATNPSFASGASVDFTLVVQVNADTADGTTLTDTASVTSTSSDANPDDNTATATTDVDAEADLSLIKTESPDPVTAGNNVTYTLTIVNNGPSDAASVTLTDDVPSNATFVSAVQGSGPTFTLTPPPVGGTGTFTATADTFAAGATAIFTLVVQVNPSVLQGGTVSNTATVASTTTDPDTTNNTDTEMTAVVAEADLSVTKTDSPDPVAAGSTITYSIAVSNAGPSNAQAVTLTDMVPANTTFVSFTAPAGFTATTPAPGGTGTITVIGATLAPGNAMFVLIVSVNANTPNGATITNTATVASTTTDPDPANNTDTETTPVVAEADLSVTKTDTTDPVLTGDAITYTITLSNIGPSDAVDVTLTDAVPVGTTFNAVMQTSGPAFVVTPPPGLTGTFTATAATFASGASATFVFVVDTNAALPGGTTITNMAAVAATTTDPDPTNNTATQTTLLATQVDLSVTKTDGQDSAVPGTPVTYTITVSNVGPNPVTGASLSDMFPAGLADVAFTSTAAGGATGNTATGTGDINDTLDMPAGSSVTYTVIGTVSASATGMLSNTVTITEPAGTLDTNPDDNTATDANTLTPQADLSVTKTDSPDPATAGTNVTYTITISNTGPSDAVDVTLTDAVPPNATFASFTAPAGFTATTPVVGDLGTITATSPTFATGTTATFILVVNINSGSGPMVSNTATVASTTDDPDTTNNSDTETTAVNTSADVRVTITRADGAVTPGGNVTYTITVSNIGPSDATGVTLTDMVSQNTVAVSVDQTSGPTFTLLPPAPDSGAFLTATGSLLSGASATFTVVVQANPGSGGETLTNTASVTATTPDPNLTNNTATNTVTIQTTPSAVGRNVIVGGPTNGTAQLLTPNADGRLAASGAPVTPFPGFTGTVRGATGDVDGDGTPDNIFVTGPGAPVRFTVISGADNTTVLVDPNDPFGGSFTGGAFVAAGDFDGDGRTDIVITPDQGGGPNVVLFELNEDGRLAPARAFFALGNPSFRGGARVAVGDVNGDGVPDLVVGAGFLGGPNIEIHDGAAVAAGDFVTLIGGGFFAFDGPDAVTLRDGVFVAVGDVDGDGFADTIFGGGPGGGPRVLVLSGNLLTNQGIAAAQAAPLANFFFGDPNSRPGVRVASKDLDNDGLGDLILGSGQGLPAKVRGILGKDISPGADPSSFQDLDVFGAQVLPGGVFVG